MSDIENDPAVKAAERARDEARELFDIANDEWLRLEGEYQAAQMAGQITIVQNSSGQVLGTRTTDRRVAQLPDLKQAARERRDAAWNSVVAANEEIRRAHMAVRTQSMPQFEPQFSHKPNATVYPTTGETIVATTRW